MTVGDLRALIDEDWGQIGLTVFAIRALKNALHGKTRSPHIVPVPRANSTASTSTSGGEENLQE